MAVGTIFLFQVCLSMALIPGVVAEEFRANIRVDRDVGAGPLRNGASIAVDDGEIYIAWEDSRNGGMDIYYSKSSNEGTSFLLDVRVNDNPVVDGTLQQRPDVVGHNGVVYVVWDDGRAGVGSHQIYFSKSTDGYVFDSNVMVSDSGSEETAPSMAIDPASGIIYVAWSSQEKMIRLARSLDNGDSFESSVLVSDSLINHRKGPEVAVDSTGKVYLVWSDGRSGTLPSSDEDDFDIYIANSTDNGQTFGTNVPVNDVIEDVVQEDPSLSIDGNDVVYVVWVDERLGTPRIYSAKSSDGSNFGPNIMVNDPYYHRESPQITHHEPSIAVNQSGSPIFVVWTDDRGSNYNVYLAKSQDGGQTFYTGTSRFGGNFFFDDNRSFNGLRNSAEAVILDNGNGVLDAGVLNGLDSPDKLVVSGYANLWEDLEGQRLQYPDMNDNLQWDKDEDIVIDTPVVHYPRVKPNGVNPVDNTTGNFITYLRWDLRNADAMYYTVEPNERMVVDSFGLAGAKDEGLNAENEGLWPGDPISSVEIEFAYKTDSGYDGVNQLTWSLSLAGETPFFQVVDTGGIEVYESVDLFAPGVDTVEEMQQLNISFINEASSQYNVSFNSMWLSIDRGHADGFDLYDILVYDGGVVSAEKKQLSDLTALDNVLFIDANATALYERGEPLLVSESHVDPGGIINESFEVLPRGDGPEWGPVFEPFPLNDAIWPYQEERPDIAVDSMGHAYIVWKDGRNQDVSDSIYFTTDVPDTVPPEVRRCYPQDGARNVSLDTHISVLFSEPMKMETTTRVTMEPQPIWDWSWNVDWTNLTYTPYEPLEYNTTYYVTINGAKDMSGNVLQSPYYCQFHTTEAPVILHDPPEDMPVMDTPIEIRAIISDNDTVTDVTLYYTDIGESNFSHTNMVLLSGSAVSGTWIGYIPPQPSIGYVSYYIVAEDAFGNVGRNPATEKIDLMVVDRTPPSLTHSPIGSAGAGSRLNFSVTVTDNLGIFKVKLFIKPVGASHFNPSLEMVRVGMSDVFSCELTLPKVDGKMRYFILAVDEWGNTAYSGNVSTPHTVTISGAPIDWGPVLLWGFVFVAIGLIYLTMFIRSHTRRRKVEQETEPES
ncbi:MAG: Ig-like domain-containing protein [Methanobacteriota archaeon]|nr:MAG: Ig-like domain-containing protein [Euryarchaeota archaeon]